MSVDTIFGVFSGIADRVGARTALTTSNGYWDFQTLHGDVLRLGRYLAEGGKSGPVAVLAGNPKDFLTAFFACAAAGRPALILDPLLPSGQIQRIAERDVGLFVIDPKFAPRFPDQRCFVFGQPLAAPSGALPVIDSQAEFYWGLTSGTTDEPKLFARSHRSWLESFAAAELIFSFPPGSRVLIPGPLSHSLFLYGAVHALCRGHQVLAPGAYRPDRAVAAARQATHAYLVPSMLTEMLDCGLADISLRLIFSGGAKLSPELRSRCEAHMPGTNVVEFYGASETSFITAQSTCAAAPNGSVGRAFPGVHIEVRDDEGETVPPGVEGEIHVSSPMLFSRYVGGTPFVQWFTAGDMGFTDAEGNLYLTGRKNRIINSRALKVRPEPIEQALLELPGICRAAVVDLPDAKRGAIAVAAVEFQPGKVLARRVLSEHCRTRLGARFSPRRYYSADALPLTRSGKIAFAALRAALLAPDSAFHELR